MKEKINLKWAKSEKLNKFNLGDDLGPYIIKELSGSRIKYIYYYTGRVRATKSIIYKLLKFDFKRLRILDYIYSLFMANYIISIGSILYYTSNRTIVWGSGMMSKDGNICSKSKYYAVRGLETLKRLRQIGVKGDIAIGDPALLISLIYKPKTKKKYKLGIIPHYIHFDEVCGMIKNKEILVINLNSPNVEALLEEICSCENIISTSLHGIIVPHSFKINSIWCNLVDKKLAGDNVKFADYFSSVGIHNYSPYDIENINDIESIIDIINNSNVSVPQIDIKNIQMDLIRAAPFSVKKEYLSKNNG
jgi:hypothetical protein